MSRMSRIAVLCLLLGGSFEALSPSVQAEAPGGWVETRTAGVRAKWTLEQIRASVPASRGAFTFPPPYNTHAVRITDLRDCAAGADCLHSLGYSSWRNTNNHVDSNDLLLFLSLDRRNGGDGPTLFRYDKTKDTITKVGPLFDNTSKFSWHSGTGWYFSATMPTSLYLNDGPQLLRYDVLAKRFQTVFDVSSLWGNDKYIAQVHSSNDDLVHSATLHIVGTDEALGCIVYHEDSHRLAFFSKIGMFDECAVDKSGHWLMSLENIDGRNDVDMRIVDLASETEVARIFDEQGGTRHADLGYGYILGADSWNALPNVTSTWLLGPRPSKGPVVHSNINWNINVLNHRSHTNARPGIPMEQQYACGSNADLSSVQNEVVCVPLDGSDRQLIVAPVMTHLDASGGRTPYSKLPLGNLDITGRYFLWTTNLSGHRLEAFLVKIPSERLTE
jgi:hypothetical protein